MEKIENNVVVAKSAGFCFGAGRAVNELEKALNEGCPIYTYGPILNNDILVNDFSIRGVRVINDVSKLKDLPKGKIVIRSHGVSKKVYDSIVATGFEVIDATCPFVKRIHNIVEKRSQCGETIVVIGNPKHPEVEGIVGWSKTGAIVLEDPKEIEKLSSFIEKKLCIVAQTTFNRNKFQEFLEIFNENSYNINVMNTICDATRIRQAEAEKVSQVADVMIVIGDPKSSNSRKLYDICRENCKVTYFIQTVDDVKGKYFGDVGLVGITAGASTPKYIIEEVQSYVRNDV